MAGQTRPVLMHLIDTNVAIYLRDANEEITTRVERLPEGPRISLLTWVELEAGVHAHAVLAADRRERLDSILQLLDILPLTPAAVRAYSRIISARGFSRPRVIDRLIAATAIVHDLTLITIDADDFRDIPGLALEVWPAP